MKFSFELHCEALVECIGFQGTAHPDEVGSVEIDILDLSILLKVVSVLLVKLIFQELLRVQYRVSCMFSHEIEERESFLSTHRMDKLAITHSVPEVRIFCTLLLQAVVEAASDHIDQKVV